VTDDSKIKRSSYRITRISIGGLKGIRSLDYSFGESLVTAILGVNGCGKSTILHALACVFRPADSASKDYNKLSDFFKSNPDADWNGSNFTVYYDFREQDLRKKPLAAPENKSGSEEYSKSSQSWKPKYYRRPVYESTYIGLQNLQTGADNPGSYRYRNYETSELALEAAELIKGDMIYILGRHYDKLNHHIVSGGGKGEVKTIIWGLESGGVRYSELSMGSGEKRVLNILSALHHESFKGGGLLLIDELDALLHRASFNRLIEVLIKRSSESRYPLQVVFTTHRETVSKFSDQINICSILAADGKTFALPYIDPDVMMQLTGGASKPIEIYVEDELSEDIIGGFLFGIGASKYVHVERFGVASNAFGLVAGKILLKQDVSSTICVLDGDVFLGDDERESEIKRHLGGDDRERQREIALSCIKSYKLKHQLPSGIRGAPEYNQKILFENSKATSEQIERLQFFSKQILRLEDWHEYYDELARLSNVRRCRDYVLDHLSSTDDWNIFLADIKEWLSNRLIEHGFTANIESSKSILDEADTHLATH
jgi:energy-coupling factor transporter ATP-binding protein EcfA2